MFRQMRTLPIALMVVLGAAIGLTAGFTMPVQGAAQERPAQKPLPFAVPGVSTRFAVKNLQTDKLTDAHEPYAPGAALGTQKVLYAGAALELLGPEFRFGTVFWARGRVKDGILWGHLVVEGHGDPTVDDVRVAWIASRLRQMGIERITHGIRLNDLYFLPAPPLPPAPPTPDGGTPVEVERPDKEITGDWSPSKALVFRENTLDVAAYHRGNRAEVALVPPMIGVPILDDVRSQTFGQRVRAVVFEQADGAPSLFVSGAVQDRTETRVQVDDSTYLFGHALYTELRGQGVRIPYRIDIEKKTDTYRWIMTDVSPELTDLVSEYLHGDGVREDVFTRALLRRIGHDHDEGLGTGTVEYGAARVVDLLESRYKVPRGSYTLDPALGETRLSAGQLVDVLDALYGRFEVKNEFARALGPARTHRQLVARGLSDDVLDIVRVHVDVVQGQAAMCGYAQRPGGTPVAFAALMEGKSVNDLVEAQNRFLEWLVHPDKTAELSSLGAKTADDDAKLAPVVDPGAHRRAG